MLEGLGSREGAAIGSALAALKTQADREAEAATKAGRPVVGTLATPSLWVRVNGILACRGNLESLEQLALAAIEARAREDVDSYQLLVMELERALEGPTGADRLKAIEALPKSAKLVAGLRRSLPAGTAQASPLRPKPTREERHKQVVEALASPDAELRVQGMLAAAHWQFDDLYATVRKSALEGPEEERLVALCALGVYGKPLSAQDRALLLADRSVRCRVAAVDVVSGFEPPADREECGAAIRTLVGELAARTPKDEMMAGDEVSLAVLSMARLLSSGVPKAWSAGVIDPNTRLRRMYVRAAVISGSPEVVPALEGLVRDPDPEIRQYAEWAVRHLPWP